MIFVNLPAADVEASSRFYEAIGAVRDERFCQAGVAASLRWSDTIVFMLLNHARFADFTPKRIVDATREVQALICLSADTREEVDATLARAQAAGGTIDPPTAEEVTDFMYGRSFADPDGHGIELMWMDLEAFTHAMPA
jgi:predicted lactoylglutathione lyase